MKLEPVIPFEPISAADLPSGPQWVAQVKWDGVRMLTYYDGHEVRLFNRKKHERTQQYPELHQVRSYASANSFIIDGEIIALQEGKPSFHRVMSRDGARSGKSLKQSQEQIPITYMVFDVLYFNGTWVMDRPLQQRQQLMTDMLKPNAAIQLVQSFSDLPSLQAITKQHDLEGIVVKDLHSTYALDGKDGRWRKSKHFKDINVVIGGVTKRDRVVNALLAGLYDTEGRLIYIGHVGTGRLKRTDWVTLTEQIEPLIIQQMPFANRPERADQAIWLQPLLTAKIQFMEWTPYMTMRQPSIHGFLTIPPAECVMNQT